MANPWEQQWAEQSAPAPVEAVENAPWEQEWTPEENPIVDSLFEELSAREGVGDDVTDVPTGELGVTEAARKAVKAEEGTPDSEVAKSYLKLLESKWEAIEGYSDAPDAVKKALIDSSYNMGEDVTKFPKATEALKKGDYVGVVEELLDSANVGGKSMKGLAKRRADLYNAVAEDKITEIEQLDDGTILYKNKNGVLFRYRPKGGKHEKSKIGTITLASARL